MSRDGSEVEVLETLPEEIKRETKKTRGLRKTLKVLRQDSQKRKKLLRKLVNGLGFGKTGLPYKNTLVMVSPAAGDVDGEPAQEALREFFDESGLKYRLLSRGEKSDTGETVRRRLKEGYDLVVACGGDGTVAAVAAGLLNGKVPLGIIPIGTANGLSKELGIPQEPRKAVNLLTDKTPTHAIDVIRVGKRIAVLNVGIGFTPVIVRSTSKPLKNRLGVFAYAWQALVNVFRMRFRSFEVVVDGKEHVARALECSVFNSNATIEKLYPEGPPVRADDGHLDVWIVTVKTLMDYPRYLAQAVTGRPSRRLTHLLPAEKSVSVKSKRSLVVQADGDEVGHTPIDIEILPGAVDVVVPKKKDDKEVGWAP